MNDDVREVVAQWVARAEADWQAEQALAAQPRAPAEIICFHCQQRVEKLLKALLTRHGVESPRTHNLRRLVALAAGPAPELQGLADDATRLTEHAVATRYPEDWRPVGPQEAQEMISLAEKFAAVLVPKLGL